MKLELKSKNLEDLLHKAKSKLKTKELQDVEMNYLDVMNHALRGAVWYLFLFSAALNLAMLMLPIYTMEVFDRVVGSNSIETLVALTIIAMFVFIIYGFFSYIREYTLIKLNAWLDSKVSEKIIKLTINHTSVTGQKLGGQFIHDMNTLKQFIASPGLLSFLDLPWSLVFMLMVFMISWEIGIFVLIGVSVLFFLTFYREKMNKERMSITGMIAVGNNRRAEEYIRNAETVDSMGMLDNLFNLWKHNNDEVIFRQNTTSVFASKLNSFSKSLRMIMQVCIMGMGTYLALHNQILFGGIIACSILAGRAMAPFDTIMGVWSSYGHVQEAYGRLKEFFEQGVERPKTLNLDKPEGNIKIENLTFRRGDQDILKDINLEINKGDVISIIGPSASGKSTLAKLILGIYKPSSGNVWVDGADIFKWTREDVGRHIGYLPQTIDLFPGTVKENISRFEPDATDESILKASRITGVHEVILKLPDSYETFIGDGKVELSGGQRQRVALARAFFNDPNIIVLDEPNSNLDEVGENNLIRAILAAKQAGRTVIMVCHKPSIVNVTDKIVVISEGKIADYGSTQEVIGKYVRRSAPAPQEQNKEVIDFKDETSESKNNQS
jgi:ATP-binding cassette subfamily C exporter for protease/lipase